MAAITPAERPARAWHRVCMTTSSQRPQGNVAPIARSPRPIDPGVTIGHVHLRTADIDRVRGFYVDLLGFDVVAEARDVPGWGTTGDILFVSAGGYHHHLGFNTWKSGGRRRRSPTASPACTTSRIRYPDARRPGRRAAPPAERRLAAAPGHRPRHPRGDLHLRPRRQRPRAVLGPPVRASGRSTATATSRRSSATSTSTTCSGRRRPRASATGERVGRRRAGRPSSPGPRCRAARGPWSPPRSSPPPARRWPIC